MILPHKDFVPVKHYEQERDEEGKPVKPIWEVSNLRYIATYYELVANGHELNVDIPGQPTKITKEEKISEEQIETIKSLPVHEGQQQVRIEGDLAYAGQELHIRLLALVAHRFNGGDETYIYPAKIDSFQPPDIKHEGLDDQVKYLWQAYPILVPQGNKAFEEWCEKIENPTPKVPQTQKVKSSRGLKILGGFAQTFLK